MVLGPKYEKIRRARRVYYGFGQIPSVWALRPLRRQAGMGFRQAEHCRTCRSLDDC